MSMGDLHAAGTPIGAVRTASGYDVAWTVAGTDKYTIASSFFNNSGS